MARSTFDKLYEESRKLARLAMNEIGRRSVAHIRDMIGIRVERIGSAVIRSEPGDPPRRDTSRLYMSVKYRVVNTSGAGIMTVEVGGKKVVLQVYTNDPKSVWLEYGTEKIEPRPFWNPAARTIRRHAVADFKRLYSELSRTGRIKNRTDIPR